MSGNVNIRGKLITGVIKTTKMKNTLIIRKDYLHYIKKYNRFEKRHKNTPVHVSPCFRVKAGDEILAGQCRCVHRLFGEQPQPSPHPWLTSYPHIDTPPPLQAAFEDSALQHAQSYPGCCWWRQESLLGLGYVI